MINMLAHTLKEQPLVRDELISLCSEDSFGSLYEMVEFLEYETIEDFWYIFGEMRHCVKSPRAEEYAYFVIEQASDNHALSLVIPFDSKGNLSHCARVVLETREQELQSRTMSWGLSRIMLEDAREDVDFFFQNPHETEHRPEPPFCEVDHRFKYPSHQRSALSD